MKLSDLSKDTQRIWAYLWRVHRFNSVRVLEVLEDPSARWDGTMRPSQKEELIRFVRSQLNEA